MKYNGLALWFDREPSITSPCKDHAAPSSVDVHINIWKILAKDNRCVDLGVMLNGYGSGCVLNIYIPCKKFSKDNFEDLVGKMSAEKWKACEAIFNEQLDVSTKSCSKFFDVKIMNSEDGFLIYSIDKDCEDLVIKEGVYEGSIVKMRLPEVPVKGDGNSGNMQRLYIRFRLSGDFASGLFVEDDLANSTLQNYVSKMELMDVRLNEFRGLNRSLVQEMRNGNIVKLRLVQWSSPRFDRTPPNP